MQPGAGLEFTKGGERCVGGGVLVVVVVVVVEVVVVVVYCIVWVGATYWPVTSASHHCPDFFAFVIFFFSLLVFIN